MSFLQVDYDRADALARELENAADKCGQSREKLKQESMNLEAYWAGNAGNAMRLQVEAAERELNTTQTQLITLAQSIRNVAGDFRRKDEGLARIIKGSGGGGGSSW